MCARPVGWYAPSVFDLLRQRRFGPFDELVGHFRRYDPPAMAALLAGCGFGQIEIRQYGFPLAYLLEGLGGRMKRAIDGGADLFRAAVEVQDHMVATARAHVERVVLERFDAFFAAKGGG